MQSIGKYRDAIGIKAAEELDDGKADIQKEGNEQVLRGATLPVVMRMRM